MSRTLYEFQLPALVDAAALRRLRCELDMRTTMSIRHHDLNQRIVRVAGRTGREDELRALFAALGFPPACDDPSIECQHRPLRSQRWRDSERRTHAQAPPQLQRA